MDFFHRNVDELRFEMLEDKLHSINISDSKEIIKCLDTYSLGVLPFIMLIDTANKLKIDPYKLSYYLKTPELKKYIDFFEKMTAPSYKDRINPNEAYRKFINLIK